MAELVNPSYTDFTIETLTQPSGIERLNSILRQLSNNIAGDTENVRIYQGYGTPEAAVAAGIGSLYMRLDGTTDTSVYRKESGSGDTGWVAIKAPASLPLSVANGGFGADNSSQVQGVIPYVSATGVISFLATSTSGYYLKTQGAGANPAWAQIIQAQQYTAGDTVLVGSLDTERAGTQDNYTLTKSLIIPRSGTLRIKFDIKSSSGAQAAYGRIYRNGVAVGTEQTTTSTSHVTKSEDISGWSAGDTCELYVHRTSPATMATQNFRLYATIPTIETTVTDTAT